MDVGYSAPIKQHPYRVSPMKKELLDKEVQYMLKNDIIEESQSNWSSPCILVPKHDGGFRFCTDFRKVNDKTKSDSFPIPRIADCIDQIGNAKFVSTFDMLKGYWQVPLTQRAREISAFVTPSGLYQYKVMPFGMKNAPATFQRMVNKLVRDIDGCEGYIDDVVIYSDNWSDHIRQIKRFFQIMREAKLTINLMKSEFGKATVKYLGHIVGHIVGIVGIVGLRCKNSNHCKIPYPHLTERTCQISRYGRILQEFLFEFFGNCCTANKFVKQKGKICLDR